MHVLRAVHDDVRALRTANALGNAGVAITIVDVTSDDTRLREEWVDGIHMRHIRMPGSFSTTRFRRWTLFKAVLLFVRSILQLLRTPADIYHACETTALPACFIAAKWRRKPLIFEAYELPMGDIPVSAMSWSRRLIHRLLTVMLTHIVPHCAGVISVSPPIVQEIRKRYGIERVVLIRNVLPYQKVAHHEYLRQQLGLEPQEKIALYQGYLQPDRSLDILVRAAAYINPGIVIVIMGKDIGTTRAELETLIEKEGVAARVKILPPVPYAELLDWTSSADIGLLICAPDYAPNIHMLLPNKLFEYLMAGLPVLASQLDAVAEIVQTHDVGQVVSSLEPADVGVAINSLMANRNTLERMSQHAREMAQREYCWEKESILLLCFYREVMQGA
ncbi:MAG: glycosyltransferase [Ktedonobacteraceae bacterium]